MIQALAFQAFGQDIRELDKRNGFKEYKIGLILTEIDPRKLEFIKELDKADSKLFKVKDIVIVEGLAGQIELAFYKDRLVEITLFFEKTTLDDYNHLKGGVESLFGKGKDDSSSKTKPSYLTDYDKIFAWKGAVMGLQLNYDVSHKVTEMVYWGLKEVTERSNEEL